MKAIRLGVFVIVVILLVCGCAQDQYSIEREFWRIKKQAEAIFTNAAATPPNELERVAARLASFVERHPKNILALESEFMTARLYLAKQEYERAARQLDAMFAKYKENKAVSSEIVFLMGNAQQLQDRWEQALAQYKKLIADYPLTIKGLEMPVYIAQYYNVKHIPDRMLEAYKEAIAHYQGLINQYPDTPLALQCYKLVASCYGAMKDWPNAVAVMTTAVEKFKAKVPMDAMLLDIALIYRRELSDVPRAREALQRLIAEYPKSRLVAAAQRSLDNLETKQKDGQ
jgi:TolA-binding protein